MKRNALAGLILATGLTLTACGSTDYVQATSVPSTSSSSEAPTSSPEPAPAPSYSSEDVLVAVLEQERIIPTYGDAQVHVELAYMLCDVLAGGTSQGEALDVLVESGYAPYDAGFFYGAATQALCPEYA